MPRTAITVTAVGRTATAQPAQQNDDQTNGMYIPGNTGYIMLELQNTNAGSRTVTFAQPGTIDGTSTAGKVITLSGSTTYVLGPFPQGLYNQPDGSVNVDFSGANSDIKIRAYQVA